MEEISQVYARSLFEVAKGQDKLDDVHEQLGELSDAIGDSHEFSLFLFSPYFTTEEKKDGLDKAVEGADEILVNFLGILLDNGRMPVIHRVRREFDGMWREENQLLSVQITSAIELDDGEVEKIGDRIGEETGRQIELDARVDPEILGGIILQVGNSILDASIRNRLNQVRRQILRG